MNNTSWYSLKGAPLPLPQNVHILIPRTYEYYLIWKKGLCIWSSWIIQLGTKSTVKCFYKRETHKGEDMKMETEIGMMLSQAKEAKECW